MIEKIITKSLSHYRISLESSFRYFSHDEKVQPNDLIDISFKEIVLKIDEMVDALNTFEQRINDVSKGTLEHISSIGEIQEKMKAELDDHTSTITKLQTKFVTVGAETASEEEEAKKAPERETTKPSGEDQPPAA